MKNILAILFILSLAFTACETECELDNAPPGCSETVPTDEVCQAYFVRWFYDESTNSCEEIGYSGCSQRGFATEAECTSCLCME